MLFFEKKRKTNNPVIYTEETCQNCNHKIKRIFRDGDYIYKLGPVCESCAGTAMITAIYGEYHSEKTINKKVDLTW